MKTKIMIGVVILVLLGTYDVVTAPSLTWCADAQPRVYNWTYFLTAAPTWIESTSRYGFINKVKERSGGRLNITVKFLGELPYKQPDEIKVLRDGLVDLSDAWNVHLAGYLDFFEVSALPTIFEGDLNKAQKISVEIIKPFMDRYLRKNEKSFPLNITAYHANQSITRRVVKSLDDIKGMIIRAAPPTQQALLKHLGATPVYIDFGEVYTALQRGTIDGGITAATSANAAKWFEVCKGIQMWNITFAGSAMFVSLDAFNKLPQDLQKIVLDTAKEEEPLVFKMCKEDSEKGFAAIKAMRDVAMTEVSPKDRTTLNELGTRIEKEWLASPKRSNEAKELYQLVKDAMKK